MSDMADREDSGFKVTDRRKYNADGSPREATESIAEAPEPKAEAPEAQAPIREPAANNVVAFPSESPRDQPEPGPVSQPNVAASEPRVTGPDTKAANAAAGHAEQAYNKARGPGSPGLPEASFLGLVNMLAVEAAMHLGLLRNPGEEPPPVDLESGRHLIDMLGMLKAKTRGNLTAEEDNLLENVLADLRMQFVAISKRR
jgi:hypothetical protein